MMVITGRSDGCGAAVRLRAFLRRHHVRHVRRLNVAGPRASEARELPVFAHEALVRTLKGLPALSAHYRGPSRAVDT